MGTIAELAAFTGLPPSMLAKSVVVVADGGPVLAIVRGEHQLHEKKLARIVGAHRPAQPEEIREWFGASPGSLGPVGLEGVRVIADSTIERGHYVTGANRDEVHLRGVVLGRDFAAETADIREVLAGEGDAVDGSPIALEPVIEVGNIFKLGTKYSEPLGATYLDAEGKERLIVMGCYGIGPARIAAAAIEQGHDEQGIVWPRAIAPFDVHLVLIGDRASAHGELADRLFEELGDLGLAGALRRPRGPQAGREVRRGRAARLPAAGHREQADAARRPAGGAGAPRPGASASCRWRAPRRRCGRSGKPSPSDRKARGSVVRCPTPRGVAQSGSAPGWGPGGRRFKSSRPD